MANSEASAATGSYHHLQKLRLLNEMGLSVYLRADWLVHKMGTKLYLHYWLDKYSEKVLHTTGKMNGEGDSRLGSRHSDVCIDGTCQGSESEKPREGS